MDQYFAEFCAIVVIHLFGVMSPGPDFAIVLKNSVGLGRRAGLFTSLGVGIGVSVHMIYCVLGLGVVVSQSILVFNIIKLLGAAYLIYIGFRSLRAQPMKSIQVSAAEQSKNLTDRKLFTMGFITNALNPKATIFFLSLFSVVINPETPIFVQTIYGLWMVCATIIWFSLVSIFFSKDSVRAVFQRLGHWFERVMGTLLILLGLRLAFANR
jgi:RhtB (resistance to homoserine/threonine) family protein